MSTTTAVFIPLPLLVTSFTLLLPLRPVLKLNRGIPTAILADEWNDIGEMGFEAGIKGISDSFQRLFLFGVVGVGPQQSFMDGDQKLTIVSRDYLYLVGKLWISPRLRGDLNSQGQPQWALTLHSNAFPGGPREESRFLVSQSGLE